MNNLNTIINRSKYSGLANCNGNTKKQIGGRKIGYGGFGCVVSPPIPCKKITKHRNSTRYVSKILTEKLDDIGEDMLNEEMEVYKILRRIDPKQNMFIYPVEHCNITNPIKRDDIKMVKFPKSFYGDEYDYNHYIEKQLKGVSDDLLETLGIDFDKITKGKEQKNLSNFFSDN